MRYHVEILPRAVTDLRSIALWWSEHHSTEKAARWLTGIEAAITGLSNRPDLHPKAVEADLFPFEVRELLFGVRRKKTHRVLFAIRENAVRVYAVRHLAQDVITADELGLAD